MVVGGMIPYTPADLEAARTWFDDQPLGTTKEQAIESLAAFRAEARREAEAQRDKLAWVLGGFKAWWQEVLDRRLHAGPLDFAPEIASDIIKRISLALDETNTAEFGREVDALREARREHADLLRALREARRLIEEDAKRHAATWRELGARGIHLDAAKAAGRAADERWQWIGGVDPLLRAVLQRTEEE